MISKTRSVSPARKLRSDPGFPHISPREMYHARPSLLTVFSITQSDHSIPLSYDSAKTGFRDAFTKRLPSLDYSRAEANPPHPFTKVEAVAHEAVVNYRKRATTKAL